MNTYFCNVFIFISCRTFSHFHVFSATFATKAKRKAPQSLTGLDFMNINYLTASFKALPALNAGTVVAAILIAAPVCGLRPSRAARSRVSKVPKPIS